MENVFNKNQDIHNNVRQSNFDWSHDNNFTTALGRITPVFCELCPPKSSVRIKPSYGLKFMPMMFPIQTRMKAYLSFYKVPLRTLWTDYMDWISSANDPDSTLNPPYVAPPSASCFGDNAMLGISGLGDYFGVPVTSSPQTVQLTNGVQGISALGYTINPSGKDPYELPNLNSTTAKPSIATSGLTEPGQSGKYLICQFANTRFQSVPAGTYNITLRVTLKDTADTIQSWKDNIDSYGNTAMALDVAFGFSAGYIPRNRAWLKEYVISDDGLSIELIFNPIAYTSRNGVNTGADNLIMYLRADTCFWKVGSDGNIALFKAVQYRVDPVSSSSLTSNSCPYVTDTNDSDTRIRLSAYPFRAYEAIYNGYIRNIRNNPFLLNNKPCYNRYVTNLEGGADNHDYQLFYANWASDQYTTALPSPQQGTAPLVGLTTYTQTTSLANGNVQTEIKTALVDEDGTKFGVSYESNGDELKGVSYTRLSDDTPVKAVSNLYDLVTSGISINDFRNVNAYQRYLELNQMRGFSYKEIVEGRFDVNVRYDALQLPEYLGGFTRDIAVNPVTQTVETSDSGSYVGALGSQSGLAGCFGQSDASISVFCDEECIIMGLLWVVPMPAYSQALPKHFLYRERLDHFNPEFDQIGYQPITYRELCPVEAFAAGSSNLDTVFGYQRPWYEYCQKLDSVHGLFRTDLQNFVMHRVFNAAPELGSSFTVVDPVQVNNVFSVTETTDKIYGQIHFDAVAKLPISRVVVPRLE